MNRGERRVVEAASSTVGPAGEHVREMLAGWVTVVKAEAPERRRAAATLVMAHFMVELLGCLVGFLEKMC